MHIDFMEEVFEEAQRQLFHGLMAQRREGEFLVRGQWVWFKRIERDVVRVKGEGFDEDVFRPE